MKLTINEIYEMAQLCVKNILNEAIKMSTAYARFYADKIPEDLWNELTQGVPNMTPFHKKVFDIIIRDTGATEYSLSCLATTINKVWREQPELKNKLISEITKCDTVNDVISLVTYLSENNSKTMEMNADNGLVKIFENDKILITCTTSYSASHKYYGYSHWCTASGVDGKYDGFGMFRKYTIDGDDGEAVLFQFVDKRDKGIAYQAQVFKYNGLEFGDIMDVNDKSVERLTFYQIMQDNYGVNIDQVVGGADRLALFNETVKNIEEEYRYWNEECDKYEEKAEAELSKYMISDTVAMMGLLKAGEIKDSRAVQPELYAHFKNAIYVARCQELPCGNKVLSIQLNEYSDFDSIPNEIMGVNAKNYLCRMSVAGGEDDRYYDGRLLFSVFFLDKSNKVIKRFLYGNRVMAVGNAVCFNLAESWDDDDYVYLNGITGEQLNLDDKYCAPRKRGNTIELWKFTYGISSPHPSYIIDGDTCEVTKAENK